MNSVQDNAGAGAPPPSAGQPLVIPKSTSPLPAEALMTSPPAAEPEPIVGPEPIAGPEPVAPQPSTEVLTPTQPVAPPEPLVLPPVLPPQAEPQAEENPPQPLPIPVQHESKTTTMPVGINSPVPEEEVVARDFPVMNPPTGNTTTPIAEHWEFQASGGPFLPQTPIAIDHPETPPQTIPVVAEAMPQQVPEVTAPAPSAAENLIAEPVAPAEAPNLQSTTALTQPKLPEEADVAEEITPPKSVEEAQQAIERHKFSQLEMVVNGGE